MISKLKWDIYGRKRNAKAIMSDFIDPEFVSNNSAMALYRESFERYNRFRKRFFRFYFRIYHRLEVIGLENIPRGPALIAANHGGGFDLDIVSLADCHPERPIHVLIADSWHYLKSRWGKYWVGSGIPLWTKGGIRYQYIDPFLDERGGQFPGLVAIFPEGGSGTFRDRHMLHRFFPGVVRIALRYRVPVVPAAMIGYHAASPILREIQRGHGPNDIIPLPFTLPVKLKIEFGAPFELDEFYERTLSQKEQWEIANEVVRPHLELLLKKHVTVSLKGADPHSR